MKKMTYEQAAEQLEAIVKQIESGDLGIDALSDKVKEATELVKICKEKLHETDASITKMLDEIG